MALCESFIKLTAPVLFLNASLFFANVPHVTYMKIDDRTLWTLPIALPLCPVDRTETNNYSLL